MLTLPSRLLPAVLVFLLAACDACAADSSTALKAALAKNSDHAARWLDERDYKSLAQSTGSLALIAELLRAKGDSPAWDTAVGQVVAQAKALQAASRDENQGQCITALVGLEQSIRALDKLEATGKPRALPKAAIRPLMLTLDSAMADAKVALLAGNVAAAKNQAAVLAELARLLSNSRTGEVWSGLAAEFQNACQAAAVTQETDTKAVRQLLRGIAERCEACHENARQQ